MNDKVIFLDLDGVVRIVTSHFGQVSPDSAQFQPEIELAIAAIADHSDAKIVISSDWRHIGGEESKVVIVSQLPRLEEYLHKDWATPVTGHRHNEVAAWLVAHPEVTNYVILEDFETHFEGCSDAMRERIVWCDTKKGLQYSQIPEVYRKLDLEW